MYDDDGFGSEDTPQPVRKPASNQQKTLFYVVIGIVIGFLIGTFVSNSLNGFGTTAQFDGQITHIDKFTSQDLRTTKVILRINDANVAICGDGDNCLGYQIGDTVKVTCFGNECQAMRR